MPAEGGYQAFLFFKGLITLAVIFYMIHLLD
jgi:hypothetical protein